MDGNIKKNDANFTVQFQNYPVGDYQNVKLIVDRDRGGLFLEFERTKTYTTLLIVPEFAGLLEDDLWCAIEGTLFLRDYAQSLAKVDFSHVLSAAQQFDSLSDERKERMLNIPEVPIDYFFFFLLHKTPTGALMFLTDVFAKTKFANPFWFSNRFPVMSLSSTVHWCTLNPEEIPQIINAYLTALFPRSPWLILSVAYEMLERYGEAVYCWKQIPEEEEAKWMLQNIESTCLIERMPYFLFVIAQELKNPKDRMPKPPVLMYPSTISSKTPEIPNAKVRQQRLEQIFAPNVPTKLRVQALKDVLARPWKVQSYENLTAIEAIEYMLYLWFKKNMKNSVHINGMIGPSFGLNYKFNIICKGDPLANPPRNSVLNEEVEWELSLIGECEFMDESNATLGMEVPEGFFVDTNYMKIEMNVCYFLQDNVNKDIAVELPEDYESENNGDESNDKELEGDESYDNEPENFGDF